MTDRGSYISVEAGEMSLDDLIRTVRERQKPIRICRNGEAVADLSLPAQERLPPTDPALKVIFAPDYNPSEGIPEDEWPEQLR
jgi:hypothetical protein